MLTIYGIKSCDTCRRARKFFTEHDIEFRFHDLREDGLGIEMIERWAKRLDWTQLLNKKSLTWRKIPEVDRTDITAEKAFSLMIDNPTLIKRPVVESDQFIAIGFSERRIEEYLKASK